MVHGYLSLRIWACVFGHWHSQSLSASFRLGMKRADPDVLVSVQIVCHNDGRWLPRCIESLRQQTIFDRIEIIIADNASQDGTDLQAQELIAVLPNARFLPTGGDFGFCVAHNRAAAQARGKYLYLFSTDTWLEPDCLESFYRAAEQENADGAGALILNYEDNSFQAKGSCAFDFSGWPIPAISRDPDPLYCIAGFYFVRRDTFFRLGLFDEKFFMYGEEEDLSWRIWISGGRLVPAMRARVHHRGAAGVNPEGGSKVVENRTSPEKRFLANRNHLLFIAKNAQHVLLLALLGHLALMVIEALLTLVSTRDLRLVRRACLAPLWSLWQLRHHILQERRRIAGFRMRGDFWMLRFFRLGFGRAAEVQAILLRGLPQFRR